MGCGSSTLAAENANIQARVRPMIKRRIDDIKRRRGHLKDSTPSKKELLAGEDCVKVSTNNDSLGRKSMPSEGSINHGAAKIVLVVVEDEEEEEAEKFVECPKKNEQHKEEGKEKEKAGRAEETEHKNRGGDLSELGEDEEGRCISPGSPSFRVYCIKSIPHDINQEEDHESHMDCPKQVLETKNIDEHPASAKSAEKDSATRHLKRRINMKFRRAIPKGGHVKSLLRVKSCYSPACSARDKAHLLQEAAS